MGAQARTLTLFFYVGSLRADAAQGLLLAKRARLLVGWDYRCKCAQAADYSCTLSCF